MAQSKIPQANIHNRNSIEQIYPLDAYAADAAENDRDKALVLHGVRIAAAPDEAGNFVLERAAHHAGEAPTAAFLAPFHRATAREFAAADPDPRHGYEAFLDEIIELAQRPETYRAADSPGPGDPRLKGLRQ